MEEIKIVRNKPLVLELSRSCPPHSFPVLEFRDVDRAVTDRAVTKHRFFDAPVHTVIFFPKIIIVIETAPRCVRGTEKNPTSVRASDVIGDFAEVAYWILRNKCGKSTKITVGDINASLDLISEKHASHDPRGHPTKFQSLCRVGSGYSIIELEELANKLAPSWLKLRPGQIPPSHLLAKEKPDLWIQPEKSCILQVGSDSELMEPFSLMDYNILVIDECGPDFCPKIVSTQWVFDCFKHKKLMPPLLILVSQIDESLTNITQVPYWFIILIPALETLNVKFKCCLRKKILPPKINTMFYVLTCILHREGYAPRFYATFNNGIAYEFVPGVILDETTCKDQSVFPLVAAMLARFHAIPVDEEEKNNPVLWTRLRKYFSLIPQQYTSEIKRKRFSEKFSRGLAGLEETISFLQRNLESEDLKVVFCHNDLLLANVICSDGSVTFIDYEYAGCSYQAFDIGNHFTEFAGVNNIDFARIPDKDFQHDWLKLYLAEYKSAVGESGPVTEDEIESLYQVVNKFILVSQVFWSTWALVQAEISELDFDFIDYAAMKMADYESRKNSIMPSGS
ncbi:unnamed protein product [Nesidiocoris tenuis]|uniref:ethanolamine kinase n=1 Tax=Nesidiocoris tenuis TaxID=355587 RepID=A0A6H5G0C4_9HEMI|nr:unnamed protein product [Nesidiocoris tenuis]